MERHSTTFRRIVNLYDEARQLLDKSGETWLTPDEQLRFKEIRAALDKLWTERRAEWVFAESGPPRTLGDNRPMPHGRPSHPRLSAYGIAPLPHAGGD